MSVAATATMAAAVLAGRRRTGLGRAPLPKAAKDEVLVRIEGCGVCASNVPVWEGRPWFDYPLDPGAPGHEAWGTVEETGERVALLSFHAFAEYDVAPADRCVPLPPELHGRPTPLEPLGCAVNVVRRAGVEDGMSVAVVGMGFLGRAVARLAERAGGDVATVRRGDSPEGPFDAVIECAGTQSALDAASALVGAGARLVLAGFHQDGPRTVDVQSWNWRGIDVVNAHERNPQVALDGMRAAAELLAAGEFDLEPLLTHRFPLARLDDAFAAASTRPPGFVKAWVEP